MWWEGTEQQKMWVATFPSCVDVAPSLTSSSARPHWPNNKRSRRCGTQRTIETDRKRLEAISLSQGLLRNRTLQTEWILNQQAPRGRVFALKLKQSEKIHTRNGECKLPADWPTQLSLHSIYPLRAHNVTNCDSNIHARNSWRSKTTISKIVYQNHSVQLKGLSESLLV